ncbi:MAG: hypothetical protein ACOCUT_00170 [bacterium]
MKNYTEALLRWQNHPKKDNMACGFDETTGEFEIFIFDDNDRLLFHETNNILDRYEYDDDSEDSEYTVYHADGTSERSYE